jgi:hypothetical protein
VAQEAREALVVQEAREALAELVVRVAPEAREALVVQEARVAPAELVVRVALAELVVRVALAELVVRVALAELVIVPVEEELEHDQAVVEQVPGHRRAQLAVALRTKLVTAAHHRGLVPVIAAEDLAAAAETTRERAATEAVIAWVAVE